MEKVKVFVIAFIMLLVLIGFAFAQQNTDDILKDVVARTDAQLASVLDKTSDQSTHFADPAPEITQEQLRRIWLYDITKPCTVGDNVVTSYPKVYKLFDSHENYRILKVYSFKNPKGGYRRVEVYLTGGDWMQYALIYLITNAGNDKNIVHAYFADELSSPDQADGAIAPVVNPLDPEKLVEYISTSFIGIDGNVEPGFKEVASVSVGQ